MLTLTSNVKIYIATAPVDMRKSFDSLSLYVQEIFEQNPLSGNLFVFFNRHRNRIKILYWDHNGLCLWLKRLADGMFRPPRASEAVYTVNNHELTLLLEGIELTNRQRFCKVEGKQIN